MKDKRSLVLAAMPIDRCELRTIFSDKADSIKYQLEHPPTIRPRGGWGLGTGDQPKLIRGELIRVENYRATIDLYRDGTLIFAGVISQNFLAWSNQTNLRLHPLALAEVVINFTRFYQIVLKDLRTAPNSLEFQIGLRNMWLEGEKNRLPGGPVTSSPFWEVDAGAQREAQADAWSYKFLVRAETYQAERVAFQLLRELYIWFGHSEEAVPYKKETGDGLISDVDSIVRIG